MNQFNAQVLSLQTKTLVSLSKVKMKQYYVLKCYCYSFEKKRHFKGSNEYIMKKINIPEGDK